MGTMVIPDDVSVRGDMAAQTITSRTASITSDMIAASANISADKLEHRHNLTFGQAGTAATATHVLHVAAGGVGKIEEINVGSVVAAIGDSTVTIDVKKNGTTVLSSVATLNSGSAALTAIAASIDSNEEALADGDVLTVEITATVGTGTLPTGVFTNLVLDENGV